MLLLLECALFLTVEAKLPQLSRDKYQTEVVTKGKNQVWVLLFYKPFCKRYKEHYQALEQAMVLTNGSVKYGEINCQGEANLCSTYKISTFPTIVIRNKTSAEEYTLPLNPMTIAKTAMRKLSTRLVEVVDDFWIDDLRSKPTAVLFTKKQNVPSWFAALSRSIHPKDMKFGICNDEGLWQDYNITECPKVVFYNETSTVEHEGMMSVRFLKESARAFLEKRESKAPLHAEFYVNAELPEICYDYTVSCVFAYDTFVDPKVDQVRIQFKNDPFRFFVGIDPLPFPNIKVGDFIIFNAKKMGMVVVDDVENLPAALDRVVDGGAKWTPIEKYDYDLEL